MDGKNKKTTQSQGLPEAVKGTIAVMLTALIVVIITMLFARGLFISNASDADRKTGWLTSTEPLETTAATTKQKVTETKKKTTTKKSDDDPYKHGGEELGEASVMTVVSAVYLHPQPTSSSENLLVIPQGATVRVYRNENGWLYLDYNGQQGYAYYTFFQ